MSTGRSCISPAGPLDRRCPAPVLAVMATIASLVITACAPAPDAAKTEKAAPSQAKPAAGPSATSTEQEARLSGGRPKFGPPRGQAQFEANCASCHTPKGVRMNDRIVTTVGALNAMPPERIYASLTAGKMKEQAASLSDRQKRNVAEYLAGRPLVDLEGTGINKMTNPCASNPPLADIAAQAGWNGWGAGVDNARFQAAPAAGLSADGVPKLKLKWAFGLPGGSSSSSQPTVVGGRVFVGSDNAAIYSMDAQTGCAYWSFHADGPGRIAPIVAPITGYGAAKYAVYFVTARSSAYAVDAQDGKLLWKTEIKGRHVISASAAYHDGRLYVPLTGTETMSGSNPKYECCRSRGGLAALDANSGKIIWKVDSIFEPLAKIGKNQMGTQLWGPSGASVWNTPTIDPKRKRIYVGTGNSYGPFAAKTSDSIIAFEMQTGRMVWHHQEFKDDAFMLGCPDINEPGGNCPPRIGQDWDFGGASVISQTLADGRDILVAAGKGGVAIALDPDQNGNILWRTKLYAKEPPTADGLVIFGGTADGKRVYFPLQQEGGGLAALQLASGKIDWSVALKTDARGQIGAASSIPGMVFTGGWDGILRAVDANGKVVWSFNTRQDFQTVNGVQAKGGSLGSPGPTIVGGIVYVASGYIGMQNGYPGNVILAFSIN
jgi:polyvinyl alcohol dehydrogenase (cytochrome)